MSNVTQKNPMAEGSLQQSEVLQQQAHANEYSCPGLATFTIAGLIIISLAVLLRFVSRKLAKAAWTADDWTILVAWLLTVGAQATYLANNFRARTCYHTYTLSNRDVELQGKLWYSWNLLYTTGYPIARISLCLLYMRVFVKRWFRMCCWFLIFCFAGYSFGSFFADIFQAWPLAANWDTNVKMIHTTDRRHLFLANAGFNIVTDALLLVLPLSIIWNLKMNWPQKLGLSCVFCLGGLTVIASIFRMQSYVAYTGDDPNYSLQADPQWWTIAELDLGILCPCLVVFGPLVRHGYGVLYSRVSTPNRSFLTKWTGYSSSNSNPESSRPSQATTLTRNRSSVMRYYTKEDDYTDYTASVRSHRNSDLEGGAFYENNEKLPTTTTTTTVETAQVGVAVGPAPWADTGISTNTSTPAPKGDRFARDSNGMATNQNAALATLDPRATVVTTVTSGDQRPMGTMTTAEAVPETEHSKRLTLSGGQVPGQNEIGVTRDFRLERD